ncbi:MAG: hypothetical protein OEM32_09185 [Acidimicrobiia bacterium]|nr:hypothetical protein [Acidimicrobiia bacterium]
MLFKKLPELVGGVLYHSADPASAAVELAEVLRGERANDGEFDSALVAVLRDQIDGADIDEACALGGAWVQGRRSLPDSGSWDLVATVPAHVERPSLVKRTRLKH